MNLGYYHKEFFQIETTEVKLYPGHKNFWEFVLCLKYLLDGTQKEIVLQRMGLHWLMQCAIADKKLMRILSSVVIRVVLFSNFTCLVWVSTLFPKPGIAPDVKLYQKSKKRGSKHHSANTKPKLTHVSTHTKQRITQTSTNIKSNRHTCHHKHQSVTHVTSHSKQTVTHNTVHTKQTTTHISTNTRPTVTHVTTKNNQTVTHVTTNTNKTVTKPSQFWRWRSNNSENCHYVQASLWQAWARRKTGTSWIWPNCFPKWMARLCNYTRGPHNTEENQ